MDPTTQSSALAAYRPEKYKGNSGQQSHGSQKDRLWCEHCNKPYHTKETCWDLHGKPADWKTRSQRCTKTAYVANAPPASSSSGNLPFTVEQMEVLKKLLQPIKDNDTRAPKEIALLTHTGDCKKSVVVAKDDAAIVDITWPPSHPRAVYSSLTVSGVNLEKLRPYLECGELKPVIDPTGPYHFDNVIEAFRYLETGRARGKVVVSCFPLGDPHSPILSGVNTNIGVNGFSKDVCLK